MPPLGNSGLNELILAGGHGRRIFFARSHGDYDVFAFLVADFRDAKNKLVLADAELGSFPDGQQLRMLVVFWANPVNHVIRLQNIFLAEHLLGFLVLSVGTENLTGDRFGALFLSAAG